MDDKQHPLSNDLDPYPLSTHHPTYTLNCEELPRPSGGRRGIRKCWLVRLSRWPGILVWSSWLSSILAGVVHDPLKSLMAGAPARDGGLLHSLHG